MNEETSTVSPLRESLWLVAINEHYVNTSISKFKTGGVVSCHVMPSPSVSQVSQSVQIVNIGDV